MDPFTSINPFGRDFAAYNAAVREPQQQQAEFEPYLDEVPQLDTNAVVGVPVSPDHDHPHLSDEDRRLIEALELGHPSARGPEDALTGRVGDAAAQHSGLWEALSLPKELTADGYVPDPPRVMMGEASLVSSLVPTARNHQAPDPGEAVRHFNRSHGYHPAPNELTGSDPLSSHEVLMGEDYIGQLRPAKRQRTLRQPEADAIGRQLSESGDPVPRVLMEHAGAPSTFRPAVASPLVLPAEGYDQDLLWAMVGDAGPSSSREPTAPPHQHLDLGEAVRPSNSGHGHQHASATLDGSSVPPGQDGRPFIVHNDRYTALFVPAAAMRRGTPLNLLGAASRLGSLPENVPQPSAGPSDGVPPALLGRTMEQAARASARAETTSPAVRDVYAASFAVPEDFSHGNQRASQTMLSKLGRWGLLPDATQPVKQYDIRGERYTAHLQGPNDVWLTHHPQE
ncbi:hypothetical protein XI03_10175 [Bradyrhizobium sp. CCBAU 65884]|nr:hypothetical protein [Bradyrhizobium sp. CCBAU 65884]